MEPSCPVCGGDLTGGDLVMVCGPCHKTLGGGMVMKATGEFMVPTQAVLDAASRNSTPDAPHAPVTCSFCGKGATAVKKLIGSNEAAICNECIALCADVMLAELGDDWRE